MSSIWSLWGQKTKQGSIPLGGTSDNVSMHRVGWRSNAEIQVTYHGSVWGEWEGKRRGILGFSIKLIQAREAILKDTQVTLSFDCHPDEKQCHQPGSDHCQNSNEEPGMQRGVVKFSLANVKRGQLIERSIMEERKKELSPSISFSGFSFTLGTMTSHRAETKVLNESWTFETHVLPPPKFNDFTSHTEVRFDWKRNEGDHGDFPRDAILCGAVIDCPDNRGYSLPMSLSITGSLKGWYFAKLKMRKYAIAIAKGSSDREKLIKTVEDMFTVKEFMASVKVQVAGQNPGQEDDTVGITSEGDIAKTIGQVG